MIFDNKQQQEFLLSMFQQASFPGAMLEVAFMTKQAVASGKVMSNELRSAINSLPENQPAIPPKPEQRPAVPLEVRNIPATSK